MNTDVAKLFTRTTLPSKSDKGLALLEILIALVLAGIGITTMYRSLKDVGRNSLDTMNRQAGATSMESAHEAIKRINNVAIWRRLDTNWIDSGQRIPMRIRVKGSAVDSLSPLVATCRRPGLVAPRLAKLEYSVARATNTPSLARDSFSASTLLQGDQ